MCHLVGGLQVICCDVLQYGPCEEPLTDEPWPWRDSERELELQRGPKETDMCQRGDGMRREGSWCSVNKLCSALLRMWLGWTVGLTTA